MSEQGKDVVPETITEKLTAMSPEDRLGTMLVRERLTRLQTQAQLLQIQFTQVQAELQKVTADNQAMTQAMTEKYSLAPTDSVDFSSGAITRGTPTPKAE